MPTALQMALGFQGAAGGLEQGLVPLILAHRERQRQEAGAQAFLQAILPLLQGMSPSGTPAPSAPPGEPGEEAFRPLVGRPTAPRPPGSEAVPGEESGRPGTVGPGARTTAASQGDGTPHGSALLGAIGKFKPQNIEQVQGLLNIYLSMQAKQQAAAEKEAERAQEEHLIRVRGEEERRTGVAQEEAKRKTALTDAESEALGMGRALFPGAPPELQAGMAGYAHANPILALSQAKTIEEGRRRRAAGEQPLLGEDVEGRVASLKALREMSGQPVPALTDDVIEKASRSKEGSRWLGEILGSVGFQMAGAKTAQLHQQLGVKIALKIADITAKGDPNAIAAANAWRQFALQAGGMKDPLSGQPLLTPKAVVEQADAFTGEFTKRFSGDNSKVKAVRDLGRALRNIGAEAVEEKPAREEVQALYPLPQTLAAKGVKPEAWNRLLRDSAFRGLKPEQIVGQIAEPLGLTPDEAFQLLIELTNP